MGLLRPGRRLRLALAAYLILLLASTIVRRMHATLPMPEGMCSALVPVVPGGAKKIRFAYRDSAPGNSTLPAVVVLHGSPGDSEVFARLTPDLEGRFRVIAPDLPGFGFSEHSIPDYSFLAHAYYVIELLDTLKLHEVQLVAFSMGGGVALSMFDLAPDRVESIVMLSAIGVQEQELLGNYWVNHFVHGVQLAFIWFCFEATPHFGSLDGFMFNVEYARNFFDSDQRPLRSILARYSKPMLIIHGREDPLVPVEAAREHHRLVPQSELVLLDENHFMAFLRPRAYEAPLLRFLENVATTHPPPMR